MVGRRLLAAALVALAGCGGAAPGGVPGPPPAGLMATLEDEVGAGGAWRTTWVLCWDPYPGAVAYELMTLTGEGASPRLRRQTDRCLRVEAAAGDGPAEGRAAQLAAQQGQLAFRVRAVPAHGPPGEWSAAVPVGTEGAYRRGRAAGAGRDPIPS